MSYCIHYGKKHKSADRNTAGKKASLFAALVICLSVLAWLYKDRLVSWLIPGDDDVTKRAYTAFHYELDAGKPFGVAFEVFCREILEDAK